MIRLVDAPYLNNHGEISIHTPDRGSCRPEPSSCLRRTWRSGSCCRSSGSCCRSSGTNWNSDWHIPCIVLRSPPRNSGTLSSSPCPRTDGSGTCSDLCMCSGSSHTHSHLCWNCPDWRSLSNHARGPSSTGSNCFLCRPRRRRRKRNS